MQKGLHLSEETWEIFLKLIIGITDSLLYNINNSSKDRDKEPYQTPLPSGLVAPPAGSNLILANKVGSNLMKVVFDMIVISKNENPQIWKLISNVIQTQWINFSPTIHQWSATLQQLTIRTLTTIYADDLPSAPREQLTVGNVSDRTGPVPSSPKSQWTLLAGEEREVVFRIWYRLLKVVGDLIGNITDPLNLNNVMEGIENVVNLFLRVANKPDKVTPAKTEDGEDTVILGGGLNGNTIIQIFGRWIFGTINLKKPGFDDAKGNAVKIMCKIFDQCRNTVFQKEYISRFYNCITEVLKDGSANVMTQVLMHSTTIFTAEYLKGVRILVPCYIYAIHKILTKKDKSLDAVPNLVDIRKACVQIMSNLMPLAGNYKNNEIKLSIPLPHFVNIPANSKDKTAPTLKEIVTYSDIRPHLEYLLKEVIANETVVINLRNILGQCYVLSYDYIYSNTTSKGNPKLISENGFPCQIINMILDKVIKGTWLQSIYFVVFDMLARFSEFYPYIINGSDLAHHIVLSLSKLSFSIFESHEANHTDETKDSSQPHTSIIMNNETFIIGTMMCITSWIMIDNWLIHRNDCKEWVTKLLLSCIHHKNPSSSSSSQSELSKVGVSCLNNILYHLGEYTLVNSRNKTNYTCALNEDHFPSQDVSYYTYGDAIITTIDRRASSTTPMYKEAQESDDETMNSPTYDPDSPCVAAPRSPKTTVPSDGFTDDYVTVIVRNTMGKFVWNFESVYSTVNNTNPSKEVPPDPPISQQVYSAPLSSSGPITLAPKDRDREERSEKRKSRKGSPHSKRRDTVTAALKLRREEYNEMKSSVKLSDLIEYLRGFDNKCTQLSFAQTFREQESINHQSSSSVWPKVDPEGSLGSSKSNSMAGSVTLSLYNSLRPSNNSQGRLFMTSMGFFSLNALSKIHKLEPSSELRDDLADIDLISSKECISSLIIYLPSNSAPNHIVWPLTPLGSDAYNNFLLGMGVGVEFNTKHRRRTLNHFDGLSMDLLSGHVGLYYSDWQKEMTFIVPTILNQGGSNPEHIKQVSDRFREGDHILVIYSELELHYFTSNLLFSDPKSFNKYQGIYIVIHPISGTGEKLYHVKTMKSNGEPVNIGPIPEECTLGSRELSRMVRETVINGYRKVKVLIEERESHHSWVRRGKVLNATIKKWGSNDDVRLKEFYGNVLGVTRKNDKFRVKQVSGKGWAVHVKRRRISKKKEEEDKILDSREEKEKADKEKLTTSSESVSTLRRHKRTKSSGSLPPITMPNVAGAATSTTNLNKVPSNSGIALPEKQKDTEKTARPTGSNPAKATIGSLRGVSTSPKQINQSHHSHH